jgi:tRNA threonylcarbamoyladenosine biosynthesis protein TsaB
VMILGIDSSDDFVSVGLAAADGVIVSKTSGHKARNKNEVHLLIDSVLGERGGSTGEIEGVAVAIGPGSFTGLRVGLAAAKGLCWSANLPLAGVSSISGLLGCFGTDWEKLLVVKDAKREEFYYGGFMRNDIGITQTIPDSVGPADELIGLCSEDYLIAGPGLGALSRLHGSVSEIRQVDFESERAGGEIARCGRRMILSGETLSLSESSPVYIRNPGFKMISS